MRIGVLILRSLLWAEFAAFVAGLPAVARLEILSRPGLTYLFLVGLFSGLAAWSLGNGKAGGRIWAWAAALSNLPVFPVLTPVGALLAGLLITLDRRLAPAAVRERTGALVELPAMDVVIVPLGIALGWAGGWSVHRYAQVSGLPEASPFVLAGALWILLPLCAALHQAGHWLGSLRAGLEPMGDWGGWLDTHPAAMHRSGLRQALFASVVGGPLASLASGAAFLGLFLASPSSPAWAAAGEICGLAAVVSLTIACLSILPWRLAGYRSDGATLLGLVMRAREANRDVCLSLLAGAWANGARPRDWDARWLRAAAGSADLSRAHATACALNYMHAMDRGYQASARYWIGRLASEFAADREAVPLRWQLEVAYFLARHDASHRTADAQLWRNSALRTLADHTRGCALRADAALAWARGDREESARLAALAESDAHGRRRTGVVDFEFERLAELHEDDAGGEGRAGAATAPTATALELLGGQQASVV